MHFHNTLGHQGMKLKMFGVGARHTHAAQQVMIIFQQGTYLREGTMKYVMS